MTIATEKIKPTSARHTLVRIAGRRDVGEEFVSEGSDVYSMTWPDDWSIPFDMYRNATQLTQVSTVSSNNQWSFNETTREIRIKTTGDVPNVDYVPYVDYYLFYSSAANGDQEYYEDPDDDTSTPRNWKGRLAADPDFSVALSDVVNGVFTIAQTTVQILNADSDFQQFLGVNDSFCKKDFTAWLFVNGSKQKTYVGKIVSLTVGDTVDLTVLDVFSAMDAQAYMGDGPGSTVRIATTAAPEDIGRPVPLIIARESFDQRTDDSADYSGATDAGEWVDGIPGYCTDYTPAQTYAIYNREWRLCRTLENIATQSFGTLVRAANPDAVSALFQFSSYSNLRVGDTMRWTNGGVPEYGRIVALGNFTYLGNAYNVRVLGVNNGFTPTANASSVMVPLKALSVWLEGASSSVSATGYGLVYLYQNAQYTITESAQSSGHILIDVTLADNMESDVGIDMSEVVDPTRNKLKFSVRTDSVDVNHSVILQLVLEAAGLTCNVASFAQAESDLVEDVKFMIPNIDETEFSNYRKYVTDLLAGTLGYIYVNNDGECCYKLLEAPAAGETRDDNNVISSDVSIALEYQDLVSAITPINLHLPIIGTRSVSRHSNNRVVRLHGITNEVELKHYMSNHDPGRIDEILAIRGERRVTYQYKTATEDLEVVLGEDVTIESDKILGTSGTKDAKVIEVSKSADVVTVTASDLLGL